MIAEEFWQKFYTEQIDNDKADGAIWEYKYDIKQLMIEFAQHHVKQALLEASKESYCYLAHPDDDNELEESDYIVSKESILNSYPDDRIK